MAKLILTVDTEAGTMGVSVNGETIEGASSVSAYSYSSPRDSESTFEVCKYEQKDDHRISTRICASENFDRDRDGSPTAAQSAIASMLGDTGFTR